MGSENLCPVGIRSAHQCLIGDDIPDPNADCDYCRYREVVRTVE